jgi:hypothetical protein
MAPQPISAHLPLQPSRSKDVHPFRTRFLVMKGTCPMRKKLIAIAESAALGAATLTTAAIAAPHGGHMGGAMGGHMAGGAMGHPMGGGMARGPANFAAHGQAGQNFAAAPNHNWGGHPGWGGNRYAYRGHRGYYGGYGYYGGGYGGLYAYDPGYCDYDYYGYDGYDGSCGGYSYGPGFSFGFGY